jgi:hypothetical protein
MMPRIPLEELHTSSAQHLRFPSLRWLLHTRRVPTRPIEEARTVATELQSLSVRQKPKSQIFHAVQELELRKARCGYAKSVAMLFV